MTDFNLGQVLQKDLTEPLDVTNKALHVSQIGRNVSVVTGDYTSNDDILAGGNIILTITPPNGVIWRLKMLTFFIAAPSGASTGKHSAAFRYAGNTAYYENIFLRSNFGSFIGLRKNITEVADDVQTPSDDVVLRENIKEMSLDADNPLYVTYDNGTDVNQTNAIYLYIVAEEEVTI